MLILLNKITYLRKADPFSMVLYTFGIGVDAKASYVVGDGLGATRGSFFFSLQLCTVCQNVT
jgi:hypothetical protein